MNKTVSRNALWLILGKLARMGIQLGLTAVTARYLGPSAFGLLHYVAAYTGFFLPLCGLGLPDTLVGELAREPEQAGNLLGTALGLQLLSGLVSAGAVWALVMAAEGGGRAVSAVAAWTALAMALRAGEVFRCWLQYRGQLQAAAMAALGAYCAAAGLRCMLLVSGKGIAWFAFAGAAEAILAGGLLFRAYRRLGGAALGISREMAVRMLERSRHFLLPGLLAAVYTQTDRVMLGIWLGDGAVGHYAVAAGLSGGWCFVLAAVTDAMYPEILRAYRTGEEAFRQRNRQLYGTVFYLSAAVSAVLCLLAEPAVVLLYGEAYRPAGNILRLLTWQTAFSYLGVARNAWVVCRDAQRYLVWVYGSAAVGNLVGNLLLIPRWGALGAVAATLAAQVLATAVVPLGIPALRESVLLMGQAVMLRGIGKEKPGWKGNWIWKS